MGVESKKKEEPLRLTSRQDKKRAREKEMTEEEKEKAAEAAEKTKARAAKATAASQAARAARAMPPEDAAHKARVTLRSCPHVAELMALSRAELMALSLVDLQLKKVELVSDIEKLEKRDQVNTPDYRAAEERLRVFDEVEANKAGRTAAYAVSSAGGGSSSPSAFLPADLSVVPPKDLQSWIAKKQLELEELKKHGQVDTAPYRAANKLLNELRKEAKERLDAKTQAKKKEGKAKTEAALDKRRDLAIANPDNYKSYLTNKTDLKWWETEGRERAEAAREKGRAAYSQGAEDPPAAPHDNGWRPPSDVATEDM